MAKLITVTSGKGGVGKTTTSINLGAAINGFGKEVIVLDANITTPNVGLHLGAPIVPVSLNHVINGKAEIVDAIYEHESGTKIVPSSLSLSELKRLKKNGHSKLVEVGKKLRKMADYVIYDSAAGLGDEAIASIESADEIVIVANPEITSVTDALKTVKLAEDMGKEVKGVIITRVRGDRDEMPISSIEEMLEIPILGIIPEDKNIPISVNRKNAIVHLFPKCRVSRSYKKIAAKLIGKNDYKEKAGFWSRLFGRD